MIDAGIVTIRVEIGDAQVDAAFVLEVLPTEVLSDGETSFVGIVAKTDQDA